MFAVDFVEGDAAKAGANGRVQVGYDALLEFEISRRNGISADASSICISGVRRGHSDGGTNAKRTIDINVLGS